MRRFSGSCIGLFLVFGLISNSVFAAEPAHKVTAATSTVMCSGFGPQTPRDIDSKEGAAETLDGLNAGRGVGILPQRKSQISNLRFQISDFRFQISNFKFQISNLPFASRTQRTPWTNFAPNAVTRN